jgi:hypothetical protein
MTDYNPLLTCGHPKACIIEHLDAYDEERFECGWCEAEDRARRAATRIEQLNKAVDLIERTQAVVFERDAEMSVNGPIGMVVVRGGNVTIKCPSIIDCNLYGGTALFETDHLTTLSNALKAKANDS